MSVPEQTTFTSSTANGVTTVFPYSFMIADEADLTVELDGVVQTVGFTISGVGNPSGGNITFSVAPANGVNVLRYLDPVLSRDTDYPQFGDLLASVLNLDFDRVWLALQALIARADRSIKLPVDTANEQLISEPAATRAGKLLGFNGAGDAALYAAADVPVTAVSPYIATLLNDTSAEEARATLGAANRFTVGGTADAMTGSVAATIITSYVAGLRVSTTPGGANTVTGPTLNLNSLGAKTIKKRDASGSKVVLVAGDYNASGPFDFEYDGTDFVLLNPLFHNVSGLAEDTTPDTANDFALVWDASASAHKKVKLNKFSGGGVTLGTAVSLTTQTSIDYTGLPSGIKRLTISFQGVSTNGTDRWLVQIGNATFTTTGYAGQVNSGAGVAANSSGFEINNNVVAANNHSGQIVITKVDTNTYAQLGVVASQTGSNSLATSGGSIALGAELERVRITTTGGTNQFDAGKINVAYE